MAVKLTLGDPVLVSMGPSLEEAGWGSHQFPEICRLPDGRIVVNYSIVRDIVEDFGKERGWSISDDNGATWREISEEELPAIKVNFGVRLPSGKNIRRHVHRPYPIDEDLYQALKKKTSRRNTAIPVEDIPDFFPKTLTFAVSEPGSVEEHLEDCELEFPGMTVGLCNTEAAIVRPMIHYDPTLAPDGTLWIPTYANGRNPKNMGFTSYYSCYYFQSTDEGKSFRLKSWIPYLPDTNEFPDAFITEGFDEPDICFMPDGGMITLMRTGSFTPSYLARSTDGGRTWSKPVQFDRCGVLPRLMHLDCGVTIATYGRPGMFIRATDDPSGQIWDDPIEVMPWKDPKTNKDWEDSCYYTRLLPVDDRTIMMAYSDFRVKDENGVDRKCILVRTIHVDE